MQRIAIIFSAIFRSGFVRRVVPWGVLLLIATALCLNHLGAYRPLTHHEVYVAQTAREMWQSGDWLEPTYFGEPRYQKPPLAYWETAVCYSLFGMANDWTARLPAALTGITFTVCLAIAISHWYGARIGWLTGFFQTTSVYFLIQARLAEADMTVAFAVALAILCFARLAEWRSTQGSAPFVYGFWLANAVALLAKGPVGPLMVASVVFCHSILRRDFFPLRRLVSPVPLMLFFILVLAWPAATLWNDPSVGTIWLRESAGRFLRDPNDVVRHPFYYPLAALWLTLPWTPLWLFDGILRLKSALRSDASDRDSNRKRTERIATIARRFRSDAFRLDLLFALWFLAPMALLSLSAGKQEHYLIPALAPCCLWSARGLIALLNHSSQMRTPRWWQPGILLVATQRRRLALGSSLVFTLLLIQSFVLPRAHGRRAYADWASRQFNESLSHQVVFVGHSVQWLCFYANTNVVRCDTLEELFETDLGNGVQIVVTQSDADAIASRFPVMDTVIAPWDGRSSQAKRPTLLRILPRPIPLAN